MTNPVNKIHLFRSIDRAESFTKKLADSGNCFGHTCTTPLSFVSSLATKINKEVVLVDSVTRYAFLLSVVHSADKFERFAYFQNPNCIELIANFVKRAAGTEEFACALLEIKNSSSNLSEFEREAVLIADRYFSTLSAFNFAEVGSLTQEVSDKFHEMFDVTWEDDCDCLPSVKKCISEISRTEKFSAVDIFDEGSKANLRYTINSLSELKANIPALTELLNCVEDGSKTLIVTSDIDETYNQVSSIVKNNDLKLRVSYKKSVLLSDTYVGQALQACFNLLFGEGDVVQDSLFRLIYNPLLNLSIKKRCDLDVALRGNPVISRQKVIDSLKDSSIVFDVLCRIASSSVPTERIEQIECLKLLIVKEIKLSQQEKQECAAAVDVLLHLATILSTIGFNVRFDFEIFKHMQIEVNLVAGVQNLQSNVFIESAASVKNIPYSSVDNVFFCDVSARAFDSADSFDALHTLLKKVKLNEMFSASKTSRLNFFTAVLASKNDVFLCVPDRDLRKAETLSVSFTFQELIYQITKCEFDDKETEKFCKDHNIAYKRFGEDDFLGVVGYSKTNDSDMSRKVFPLTFKLNSVDLGKHLRKTEDGRFILSPSQIEAYIQCPYKWFYERRINPKSLDFEFNQIIKGNIIHDFFNCFYKELAKSGIYRLEAWDLEFPHKDLFEYAFDLAVNKNLSSDSNMSAMAALESFSDQFDLMQLQGQVIDCLKRQTQLPNRYLVAESEFPIDERQNVVYAGVVIGGRVDPNEASDFRPRIDRIDVCAETNSFLVIDYKGSIKDYCGGAVVEINPEDGCAIVDLPKKVQTLIYASCVRKMTARHCDGAIYLAYKQTRGDEPWLSGSVQSDIISDFSGFGKDARKCSVSIDMDQYLDFIEMKIKSKLENLKEGFIVPCPMDKTVCQYCNVSNCPARGKN